MTLIAVNLGSNFQAQANLDAALNALSSLGHLQLSSRYQSPAVGITAAAFHNQAACFDSDLTTRELHSFFKKTEIQLGRAQYQHRNDIQPIDIDFLLFGNLVCDSPTLPHKDILLHAHVLCPLSEVLPDFFHPTAHQTLAELWHQMQHKQSIQIKKVTP